MATIPVVNTFDKRTGIAASIIVMVGIVLYLFLTYFEFADPPPKDIPLKAQTVIEEITLEKLRIESGGSGGGEPSDAPIDEPKPQVQQVITKPKSNTSTTSGQANQTNTNQNSNNSSSTTQQSSNPFGGGGGTGTGGGSGGKFGQDSGSGSGTSSGSGNGEGRIRLNNISVDNIQSNMDHTIYLILTINAEGYVIDAKNNAAKTTTTDQRLINQVVAEVIKSLRYNKDPGAGLQKVYYTVGIKAS